jgi:hypothetical protein
VVGSFFCSWSKALSVRSILSVDFSECPGAKNILEFIQPGWLEGQMLAHFVVESRFREEIERAVKPGGFPRPWRSRAPIGR